MYATRAGGSRCIWRSSVWSLCLPSLIDAAERDPEAREVHARLARNGRQNLVDLLTEGVARGEFPARLDPELMSEALAGPIILRRLMSQPALEPHQVRAVVDQLLPLT